MYMIQDLPECEYLKDETGKSIMRRPTKGSAKDYARRYAKRLHRLECHFEVKKIPKGSRL